MTAGVKYNDYTNQETLNNTSLKFFRFQWKIAYRKLQKLSELHIFNIRYNRKYVTILNENWLKLSTIH